MKTTEITQAAWHAIRAATMRASWGNFAAARYAEKHGVRSLYRLACQLAAVQ